MRELTQAEVGYLAGVLDGEGAISILRMRMKRPSGIYWHYALQVRIANTKPQLHEWIQARCGGQIYDLGTKGNRKPGYVWHLSGRAAKGFLCLVKPYLVIKGKQADLALRFLALGREFVPHLRAELRAQMRDLNRRGADDTTAIGSASVTRELAQLDFSLHMGDEASTKGE